MKNKIWFPLGGILLAVLFHPVENAVAGKVRGGRLAEFDVTPPERRADVIVQPELK